MPTLHNPHDNRLTCYRINRTLEAGETVEITDEEAEDLRDGTIFVVEGAQEREQVEEADAEDGSDQEDESDESEPSDAPKRETVRRGGKRAEVTKAPDAETRG